MGSDHFEQQRNYCAIPQLRLKIVELCDRAHGDRPSHRPMSANSAAVGYLPSIGQSTAYCICSCVSVMCTTNIAVLLMYSNNWWAHLLNSWVNQRSLELFSLVKGCSVVGSVPCLICECPVLDVSQVKATNCAYSRNSTYVLLAVVHLLRMSESLPSVVSMFL